MTSTPSNPPEHQKALASSPFFQHPFLVNLYLTKEGLVVAQNELASKLFKIKKPPYHLDHLLDPKDQAFFKRRLEEVTTNSTATTFDIRFLVNQQSYTMKAYLANQEDENQLALSLLDQSITRNHLNEIKYLSLHDQLTHLYNRRFFEEEIKRLDNPRHLPLGVIFADMNGLKLINDTFGHETGDRVLINVAQILKDFFRAGEIIARVGGDEFIVLIPQISPEALTKRLQQLRAQTQHIIGCDIPASMATGSCIKTSPEQPIATIINAAEELMYQRKLYMTANTHKNVIDGIIATLHEKHPREEYHSKRVSFYMEKLAASFELPESQITTFRTAGLLHDIGKIALDYSVLDQPRKLTDTEYGIVKRHPEVGYRILKSAGCFTEVTEMVLSHHERMDGQGYPRGLSGDQISFGAKCLAVCDTYDAMTAQRPYKKVVTHEEACQELQKHAGTQFDPTIVKHFVKLTFDEPEID